MATSKEFVDKLSQELPPVLVRLRPMMGEYLMYYKDKLVGGLYDNRLLVKPVDAVKRNVLSAKLQIPYDGAKPMVHIENTSDGQFLLNLFEEMYAELPDPKTKKRKK